jgi:rare lipoprotein A
MRRHVYRPHMLPTIIPAAREGYTTVLRGRASWYGRYFQGKRTTSGERFDRFQYTCAHKTLPFGTRLRVTSLTNGVAVVVRVIDRGPFRHQRIIDLAEVAARPLGLVQAGATSIVAEIVPTDTPLGLAETPDNLAQLKASDPNPKAPFTAYLLPEAPNASDALAATKLSPASTEPTGPVATALSPAPANQGFVVQAGTFADSQKAQALLARVLTIDQALPAEVLTVTVNGRPLNRVVIGQLDSWLAAETVRRNLQLWGIAGQVCHTPTATPEADTQVVATAAAPFALSQ